MFSKCHQMLKQISMGFATLAQQITFFFCRVPQAYKSWETLS